MSPNSPVQKGEVTCLGNFANPRYRGTRMPPIELVEANERKTMYLPQPYVIQDARQSSISPNLTSFGFCLIKHKSRVVNMLDEAEVTSSLYRECERVIKNVTGCEKVIVTQHQYRNGYGGLPEGHPRAHRPTPNGSEGSYAGIHSDVTPYSERGWEPLAEGRHFHVCNLWRSTDHKNPICVMPLSLCDATSVDPHDMICADSWGQSVHRRRLVSYRLAFNESQRWHYFPKMQPDELLIFKQYDTTQDSPNMRATFHGAIDLPNTPSDAPLRNTIEVRVMALFGEERDRPTRLRKFLSQVPTENPNGQKSSWVHGY